MVAGYKKKLIEVALPLEGINEGALSEENNPFLKGHPRSIHTWWARRPLTACRAILLAQLIDDPSARPDEFPSVDEQDKERKRIFNLIEQLSNWENLNNETLLAQAHELIKKSCGGQLPKIYDPFSGRASISMEAMRLGLETAASDINPVAVMIGKALLELPSQFHNYPPVNPDSQNTLKSVNNWNGTRGLALDIVYYGQLLKEKAIAKIGNIYPKAQLTDGSEVDISAWVWVRTVISPNPALSTDLRENHSSNRVPLASSFLLSTKKGREAWIEPVIAENGRKYSYSIKFGNISKDKEELIKNGTKSSRGANFNCLLSGIPIPPEYIKSEGTSGRIVPELMALVIDGKGGKTFLSPDRQSPLSISSFNPEFKPDQELPNDPRNFWTPAYGLKTFGDLFTDRQLVALSTLCELVTGIDKNDENCIRADIYQDALLSGWDNIKAEEYAKTISVYLAFAIDKLADYSNSLCTWNPKNENIRNLVKEHSIPMAWDFVEVNVLQGSLDVASITKNFSKIIENLPQTGEAIVSQNDITRASAVSGYVIATDPPYYDNVAYADLADFFYVWLRKTLRNLYPDLFSTLLTPKATELVATPYRLGSKKEAEKYFLEGMTNAVKNITTTCNEEFPITIFYAFKQSEVKNEGIFSTGWATFLDALIKAGLTINGTWPVRTERAARLVGIGKNALASSIVMVCRKLALNADICTKGEFVKALRRELPEALKALQHSNLAPVDMAQASIGPGMAIFSRYAKVMESDGSSMSVRTAIQLINEVLDQYLAEQEGEYDPYTRFAIIWFQEHGTKEGNSSRAETLANAKNVSIKGVEQAGIFKTAGGKAWLIKLENMPSNWDPLRDDRPTVWEAAHHLIRVAFVDNGYNETAAAELFNRLGSLADAARDLAYRLYKVCNDNKWADEALAYNNLVTNWPSIMERANQLKQAQPSAPIQQMLEV